MLQFPFPKCRWRLDLTTVRALALTGSIVVVSTLTTHASTEMSTPVFSFNNPFHPQQCGKAIQFARLRLRQAPTAIDAQMLLAEGLLCSGLADDPTALDGAIRILKRIVRRAPTNFFAQLGLADALRKRFPLSDDALLSLARAQELSRQSDLGEGRQELMNYIRENRAAIDAYRSQHLPSLLRARMPSPIAWSDEDLGRIPSLMAQRGPQGQMAAVRALKAYSTRHPNDVRTHFYRTEVLRGRAADLVSTRHYKALYQALCSNPEVDSKTPECSVIRLRLSQLAAACNGLGVSTDGLASETLFN